MTDDTLTDVVLFSGGIGSWAAAKRAAEERPVTLLFTDTRTEDADLYRFLHDAAENVGMPLVTIADGRDIWQVFNDEKFIGNTRADVCSRILKRDLARRWIDEHCAPGASVYIGVDWSEIARYERAAPRWEPYKLKAPLCDPPLLSKDDMIAWARREGLKPPRLYAMGFPHNNCGGFCVKQGQAAFVNLLRQMPDRYAYHEEQEDAFRASTGKDVAVLRDRRGGKTRPLPLRLLRQRYERWQVDQLNLLAWDGNDWGGCGCMIEEPSDD